MNRDSGFMWGLLAWGGVLLVIAEWLRRGAA